MDKPIVNRVAKSNLITFDLEVFYPKGERKVVDISQWLWEGMVLKEKEFRNAVALWDTTPYQNTFVALQCNADAIVPAWAFMLVTTKLSDIATKVVVGTLENLENVLYTELLHSMDFTPFQDKPIIIKGCSNKPIPQNAYTLLVQKLRPVAKSISYGEACSSVPLFKK